ncbi:MAG: hypothetical protein PF488_00150 [Patescibacteria group bacterium]|jgi:hypothetical protein|nr:hypothetical protein [Patescibacteria group bacterium]
MEFKIIGKMSLENFENKPKKKNPEIYAPEMKNRMKEMADNVNERYGEILDSEGRIKVTDSDDLRYVKIKEEVYASERGMSLESYQEKQEKSSSSLAEQAITLSLSKVLGSRFLSLRSSTWDDYENGVDNVLVDMETGSLVCGFDEVVEGYNQDGKDIKEEKIMKKFKKGGAHLKYGLEVSNEESKSVNIKSQKNLPNFYISVNKNELSDLMENVSKPEISSVEKKVLNDFVFSLESQIEKMNDVEINIPRDLKNNLEKAKSFVETLKEKI